MGCSDPINPATEAFVASINLGGSVSDCYRDTSDTGTHPYRVRVNGELLRTKDGLVRKFRTLAQAVKASR